jgi:hypothetical protein
MQHFCSSSIRLAARLARPTPVPALQVCRRAAFQAHFRPASVSRGLHTTLTRLTTTPPSPSSSSTASSSGTPDPDTPALSPPSATSSPSPETFKLEPRLQITFTCTADDCGHRSSHEFTKRSYETGIVIVQCPGCKNRCVVPPFTFTRFLFFLILSAFRGMYFFTCCNEHILPLPNPPCVPERH